MRDLAIGERVDRVGKDVESLFHYDPAQESDNQIAVRYPEPTSPCHIAAVGIELLAVDAAAPD